MRKRLVFPVLGLFDFYEQNFEKLNLKLSVYEKDLSGIVINGYGIVFYR